MTSLKGTICLLVCLLISVGTSSFASANASMSPLAQKAAAFLLNEAQASHVAKSGFAASDRQDCPQPVPASIDCIQFVAGPFPSTDQKVQATRACIGNGDADCAKYIAGDYASFDQRVAAALACRNVVDEACTEYVAGPYASVDQKIEAARACVNASVDCVKYTAGDYASFEQKVAAAKACGGQ